MFGDKKSDRFVKHIAAQAGFFQQNGYAHFQFWRFDGYGKPPAETRNQATIKSGNFLGEGIAGHDDLLMRVDEGVEGVEKFFLRLGFAGEKLNIVDQQDVERMVILFEFFKLVGLVSAHHIGNVPLGVHIADFCLRVVNLDLIAHRLDQVGFAQTYPAVNK